MQKQWIIRPGMGSVIRPAVGIFFFYVSISFARAQPPVKETGGFHHPESVCQSGNSLFVSEMGATLEPAKKDGDGYIGKIDLSTGKLVDAHFLPATGVLDAPKGMALDGHTLYVADIDHIVGFDIVSRKKVADIAIAGTSFLNDLVPGDGKLYASATDNGKIYEVDLKTKDYRALPLRDSITGANGLYFDKSLHRLYCVSIGNWSHPDGTVFAIDLQRYTIEKIADYQGLLDGVALAGNTLYFSDWKSMQGKGLLLVLDLSSHVVSPLHLPGGDIAGPADFSISKDEKYFIIPATLEGKILFRPLGEGRP